jgi:uncharacterized protein YdhG (YjbR/CyaY superfamily)
LNQKVSMTDAIPESTRKYLEPLTADQRRALLELRQWILAAAPGAEESLNYGVPAFKLDGRPLVSLGAARKHCAFYVQSPAVSAAFAARLAGLDTSPGTIRFTPDRPLPRQLVEELVAARIAENAARPPKR